MNGLTRYYIIGRNKSGTKEITVYSTSNESDLRLYIKEMFKDRFYNPEAIERYKYIYRYTYIVDWQDRKQVSLLQYAQEQNII